MNVENVEVYRSDWYATKPQIQLTVDGCPVTIHLLTRGRGFTQAEWEKREETALNIMRALSLVSKEDIEKAVALSAKEVENMGKENHHEPGSG